MGDEMRITASEKGIIPAEVKTEDQIQEKESKNKNVMIISYKECMKNHAAVIGGNARDGCGEFIPIATKEEEEEGSVHSLTCSACGCHRNFHRKEIRFNHSVSHQFPNDDPIMGRSPLPHSRYHHCCNINFPASSSMDNMNNNSHMICQNGFEKKIPEKRKRFRTKFTEEQKEKMVRFAEKSGWGMQNVDESVVKEFCEEVGIKRRVLKVWVHNNKHSYLSKKLDHS